MNNLKPIKCNICGKENENEICESCSKELIEEAENIQKEEYQYVLNHSF